MTGADRVRQVAKWVIAAFAAVGGALAAGVPLSSVGSVSAWRAVGAGAAVLVALAGIVLAVTRVARTLEPKEATLDDLKHSSRLEKRLEEDESFYGGFVHDRDQLIAKYLDSFDALRDAQEERWEQLRTQAQNPAPGVQPKVLRERLDTLVETRKDEHEQLEQVIQFWRSIVIYEEARGEYQGAKWRIGIGATLAALGLVGFAYAANPPKPKEPKPETYCLTHSLECRGERGLRGHTGKRGPRGRRGPRGYTSHVVVTTLLPPPPPNGGS